jgi:hypothetical protein
VGTTIVASGDGSKEVVVEVISSPQHHADLSFGNNFRSPKDIEEFIYLVDQISPWSAIVCMVSKDLMLVRYLLICLELQKHVSLMQFRRMILMVGMLILT